MMHFQPQGEALTALLAQAGRGDAAAFRRLHACSASRLLPFAMRIVKTREVAEEVLQESFLAIWREAGHFDSARSAPMTWMSTIVRNKAVDYLRANRLREGLTDADWDEAAWESRSDPRDDPCQLLERHQWRRQIDLGLTDLEAPHRTAIELAFFDELSHVQVARAMTLPLGTVKTWIRRGCQQMRTHMERGARSACLAGPG